MRFQFDGNQAYQLRAIESVAEALRAGRVSSAHPLFHQKMGPNTAAPGTVL